MLSPALLITPSHSTHFLPFSSQGQNQLLLTELERQQTAYNDVEDKKSAVVDIIEDAYFRKQMNLEHILLLRKRAQRFGEAAEGKLVVSDVQAEKAEAEWTRNKENFDQIKVMNYTHRALRPCLGFFLVVILILRLPFSECCGSTQGGEPQIRQVV
jgi:hypothetical protein